MEVIPDNQFDMNKLDDRQQHDRYYLVHMVMVHIDLLVVHLILIKEFYLNINIRRKKLYDLFLTYVQLLDDNPQMDHHGSRYCTYKLVCD